MPVSLLVRVVGVLVVVLSVALVVTGMSLLGPVDSAEGAVLPKLAAMKAAAGAELGRPDAVSAMVTTRAGGQRVEDLSRRDETTQVFANPDGTWTAESASEPVRVEDDEGGWHDVDTTLVERDGGLAPRFADTNVVLSDGGDETFASRASVTGFDSAGRVVSQTQTSGAAGDQNLPAAMTYSIAQAAETYLMTDVRRRR